MGQSVSADVKGQHLSELLSADSNGTSSPVSLSSTTLAGIALHHVKAWKFDSSTGSLKDVPVDLLDGRGRLTVDLQKSASYLILHVQVRGSGSPQATFDATAAALGGVVVSKANAACSPRGLLNKVSQGRAGNSNAQLEYALFVWQGVSADAATKANSLVKAFELDRQLRSGLLCQQSFVEGLRKAMRFSSDVDGAPDLPQALDQVDKSGNRLISSVSESIGPPPSPPAALSPAFGWFTPRSRRASAPASTAAQQFSALSLSVWHSLGVTVQETRRPEGASRATSSPRGSRCRGFSADKNDSQSNPPVPRLALGAMHPPTYAASADAPADSNPKVWPAGLPLRPSPAMGTPVLSCNPGDVDLVTSGRSWVSSSRDGSTARTSPRAGVMSPHGQVPKVSHMGVPGLNLVGAESRGRLEKVAEADTMTTARRQEVLRPSEIKQMELAKFQESCSEIVPDAIYISSYAVASDLDSLKRHRITHILNMAADICENRFPDMFDYSSYYVRDASSEDISVLFYKTLEWMQAAILHGGRVLVHCREGVSRSATMVIAYLMWSFQLPFKEAHDRIRRVRPICNPNPGFTYHLLELGNRLGNGGRHSSAKARVFRVRPHHPKNPFLLLVPVEKPSKPPLFDPRFGWVVQSSQKIVVWLGSQVPDAEAVENFVRQHVRMMESFEKCKFTVTVMQEGKETSLLWQMLELPTAPSGIEAVSLAVYDADYEVMRAAVKARR